MQVHAYCVCDDPDYFYDYVQGLIDGLEAGVSSHDIVNIQNVELHFFLNTFRLAYLDIWMLVKIIKKILKFV